MRTTRTIGIWLLLGMTVLGDDWSHLGRDDARTRLPAESIVSPAILGQVSTGSSSAASPVVGDGYLVTAGLDGVLRGYRESDLAPLWSAALESPIIGTPLVDRGRVYVPVTNGTLHIRRLADGASLGTISTGSVDYSSPVLSGGLLYQGLGFPNNSLGVYNAPAGTPVWSQPLDQVTNSSPALADNKVIIATNNGTVTAFNLASPHDVAWSTDLVGNVGPSSPLVVNNSVFMLVNGSLTKMDLATGSVQDALAFSDDPAPADTLGTSTSGSSLAFAPAVPNGLIVGVVRFEYSLDHNLPPYGKDGYVDAWTMRDVAFAVDPETMTLQWQKKLGEISDVALTAVPPYRLVPTPVTLGTTVAFASSVASSLLIQPVDGSPGSTIALDAPSLASPFVANARLYALTKPGTLYAIQGTHAPPAAATLLTPSATELAASPGTLSWTSSSPGATYTVRIDSDGELLMSWMDELPSGTTSVSCPSLPDGYTYTWGVRVRDTTGAYSGWSYASFDQAVPPQPPSGLAATPKHARVLLSWTASPSSDVAGYRLAYGPTGGALGAPVDLGPVTSTAVSGLTNGTSYTFEVRAVDGLGLVSTPATVDATPIRMVSIGGTGYDTIAGALAAAKPGQTVTLGDETFTIDSTLHLPHQVTLSGSNARDTRIQAASPIVMIEADSGSTVELLALDSGSIGVGVPGSSVKIRNCVIRNMTDAGVDVSGSAQVINNTILNNATAGLRSTGTVHARNNIVQSNGVGLLGSIVSIYNDVSDGYSGCAAGTGDLASPVAFLDLASGDYREQPAQPSLDTGSPGDDYSQEPPLNGGRINMGAFGNTPLAAASATGTTPHDHSTGGGGCGATTGAASGSHAVALALLAAALFLFARRR